MLTKTLRASTQAGALTLHLDRQLGRFAERFRHSVHRLALRRRYLADLAVSFPALLYALAVPRRGFHPEPVITRVIAGASLVQLCEQAEVAFWLRKLPPEAFAYHLVRLPDGGVFRREIANRSEERRVGKECRWRG